MTGSNIKSTKELLNSSGSVIQQVYENTKKLTKLQKTLLKYLPQEVQIASFREGNLHLVVTDGALASHIRYTQRDLIEKISKETEFFRLKSLQISIQPKSEPTRVPERRKTSFSEEALQTIERSAEYIKDARLKKALSDLAKHARSPENQP